MTKKVIGLLASVALLGSGAAFAQGGGTGGSGSTEQQQPSQPSQTSPESQTTPTEPGTGGSGQAQMGQEMGAGNEIEGTVVKAEKKTVYLEHMGMVIPLKIDSSTKFTDAGVKNGSDFKEGEKVRANFSVKSKTENVATKVWRDTGTGGSGTESMPQPSESTPPPSGGQQPGTEPGTGGSGTEQPGQPGTGGGMDQGTGTSTDQNQNQPGSTQPSQPSQPSGGGY